MDLFTIVIEEGNVFYKGVDKPIETLKNEPLWLGDLATARDYGSDIVQYTLTKSVKLLDVANSSFHTDFIARVNNMYGNKDIKGKILAPLGLPDFETQMQYVRKTTTGLYQVNPNVESDALIMKRTIDKYIPFIGYKHRYSVEFSDSDEQLDKMMVDTMKRLYPEHDGYTCLHLWPSYHHNGFLRPETCLFYPITCLDQGINKARGGGKKQKGGTSQENKEELPEDFKKMGWTDPKQIFRQGRLKEGGAQTSTKRNNKK